MTEVPVGGGIIWFSQRLPGPDWVFAKGQLLDVDQYSELFSEYGTMYGGDGTTTFGVPDMAGFVPVGQKNSDPEFGELGDSIGTKTETAPLPVHDHPLTGAPSLGTLAVSPNPHDHSYTGVTTSQAGQSGATNFDVSAQPSQTTGGRSLSIIGAPGLGTLDVGNAGTGGSHNNIQPSRVVNWAIRVR